MSAAGLGDHVLIDLYGCAPELLSDVPHVERTMTTAARAAGATIVKAVFHAFNPVGVSGVVVITESHLAIHTWPEHAFASVDLFTCGASIDAKAGIEVLRRGFRAERVTVKEVQRGELLDLAAQKV